MASYFTLDLITQTKTHLWNDSLFFLQKSIELQSDSDSWFVGTYARGSILFSVAAFETSCGDLFHDKDFSNHQGILNGIECKLKCKYGIATFDKTDALWKAVKDKLNYRNIFAHGKVDQNGLFIDYPEAINVAIILLNALTELYRLTCTPIDSWIGEYRHKFENLRL